jgi:hypothetical protein
MQPRPHQGIKKQSIENGRNIMQRKAGQNDDVNYPALKMDADSVIPGP